MGTKNVSNIGFGVPSFLFSSPDASSHIFDFLSDPYFGKSFSGDGTSGGILSNWTNYCTSPRNVVSGSGPFLGCLLYPNVTRHIRDGTLPMNLTSLGFPLSNGTDTVSSGITSQLPTCLVSYCASQPDCASSFDCSFGNMITGDRNLSAHGVAKCWQTLCSLNVQSVNSDIAGVGVLISYVIQSVVALLGLTILTMLACLVMFYSRKAVASPHGSDAAKRNINGIGRARRHWEVGIAALSEFHKAQCYLAIALQIAAFVLIFRDLSSTSYNDQNLLLLVGLDGLIPINITLYTLMTFGKKSWYMIILSVITVILAAVQGGYITQHILLPQSAGSTAFNIAGGDWPALCGGIGPMALCSGMGENGVTFLNSGEAFIAIMGVMVAITALLVLWKISTETTHAWPSLRNWLAIRLPGQARNDARNERNVQYVERLTRIFFHSIVAVALLGCLAAEVFYFAVLFNGPLVNLQNWSFGQIVGITIWAGVFVDFAYLAYFGLDEGSNWRYPRWLEVKDNSKAQADAVRPPHLAEHAEDGVSSTESGPFMIDKGKVLSSSTMATQMTLVDSTIQTQPQDRTFSVVRHILAPHDSWRRSSKLPKSDV